MDIIGLSTAEESRLRLSSDGSQQKRKHERYMTGERYCTPIIIDLLNLMITYIDLKQSLIERDPD